MEQYPNISRRVAMEAVIYDDIHSLMKYGPTVLAGSNVLYQVGSKMKDIIESAKDWIKSRVGLGNVPNKM